MRILVYDDNKIELESLSQKIISIVQKEKVSIDISSSFIEDKLRINHCFYDIAIVVFNHKDTLFLLNVLVQRNKDCKIIFIGKDNQQSVYAFYVQAYQFLLKDEVDLLNEELRNIIDIYKKENIQVNLYINDDIKKVFIKDILYLETRNKKIILHCMNESFEGKVKNIEKLKQVLLSMNFVHIHQSYYVHIESILSLRRGEVTLKNKETLPVSLKYRNDLKEKVNRFYQLG